MVDKSAIGATDAPFTMPVERGKIREFARATMSSAPEYLDDPGGADPADVPHHGLVLVAAGAVGVHAR